MQHTIEENASHHAGLMDQIYKRQRFIYDASRKYYLLGRDQLITALNAPENSTILEVGCGTGRNLICTAKQYQSAAVYGVDISTEMLKTAGRSIYKANLAQRINLAKGDATNFNPQTTFGINQFDRIFISFSLSMIPSWQDALNHSLSLLNPAGELHIVDFGECDQLPKPFKTALYKWLALFHVHPIPNMPEKLQAIAKQNNCSCEVKFLYGAYSLLASFKKTPTQ